MDLPTDNGDYQRKSGMLSQIKLRIVGAII